MLASVGLTPVYVIHLTSDTRQITCFGVSYWLSASTMRARKRAQLSRLGQVFGRLDGTPMLAMIGRNPVDRCNSPRIALGGSTKDDANVGHKGPIVQVGQVVTCHISSFCPSFHDILSPNKIALSLSGPAP